MPANFECCDFFASRLTGAFCPVTRVNVFLTAASIRYLLLPVPATTTIFRRNLIHVEL